MVSQEMKMQEDDFEDLVKAPEDDNNPPAEEKLPPRPGPNKASPPFCVLTSVFTNIETNMRRGAREKKKTKGDTLREFFSKWRQEVGPDVYPLVRLLLPDKDTRRKTYGLKEAKLAAGLVLALDLPKGSTDAERLTQWKVPSRDEMERGAGEFSTVAYEVIKGRSTVTSQAGALTIDDVNKVLDLLSKAGRKPVGAGKASNLSAPVGVILKDCVQKMTPNELRWFMRIVLRDLKIGMSERTVLHAMHEDAMDLFNTCSDILRVCWQLWNPAFSLPKENKFISTGNKFRPMLCNRNARDLADIVKVLRQHRANIPMNDKEKDTTTHQCAPNEFLIEEKFDGERIQLHKRGNVYSYYSRKSTDYTNLYGESPSKGSLTPFIHDLIGDQIQEVVLDGEMLVWDPSIGKYLAFGVLKSYASIEFGKIRKDQPRPCFKVFDILYVKTSTAERCFLEVPLWKRKDFLRKILREEQGVLEIADVQKASTKQELMAHLSHIVEDRGEGIVVKHPNSFYVLGGRDNAWIKVKPDYMDELGETIDGTVIGGYWGQGSRAGYHASFLIGLRDETKPLSGANPHFRSFAKVGSGISYTGYQWIKEKTEGKWFNFDKKRLPPYFSTVNEFPDQLIKPEDSFVLTVRAAEIVAGKDYAAGLTLRFPRTQRIREDLDFLSSFTMENMEQLRAGGGSKRVFGSNLGGKHTATKAKRTRKAKTVGKAIGDVDSVSNIFEGTVFYVHTFVHKSAPFMKQDELQKIIKANGGSFIQTFPSTAVNGVVVATNLELVSRKTQSELHDFLRPEWLLDSVRARRVLPKLKKYYLKALDETTTTAEYNAPDTTNETLDEQDDEDDEEEAGDGDHDNSGDADVEMEEQKPVVATRFGSIDEARSALWLEDERTLSDEEIYNNARAESDDEDDDHLDAGRDSAEEAPDVEDVIKSLSRLGQSHDQEAYSHGWDEAFDTEDGPVDAEDSADTVSDPAGLSGANPGMGAGQGATEIDVDKPFQHFVCYFDTTENATRNKLPSSLAAQKTQDAASATLDRVKDRLLVAGGQVTDNLLDPLLTHIIVHSDVQERYIQLKRKTKEPRWRKLLSYDWIDDSIDEGDVVDDTPYMQ